MTYKAYREEVNLGSGGRLRRGLRAELSRKRLITWTREDKYATYVIIIYFTLLIMSSKLSTLFIILITCYALKKENPGICSLEKQDN